MNGKKNKRERTEERIIRKMVKGKNKWCLGLVEKNKIKTKCVFFLNPSIPGKKEREVAPRSLVRVKTIIGIVRRPNTCLQLARGGEKTREEKPRRRGGTTIGMGTRKGGRKGEVG